MQRSFPRPCGIGQHANGTVTRGKLGFPLERAGARLLVRRMVSELTQNAKFGASQIYCVVTVIWVVWLIPPIAALTVTTPDATGAVDGT